MHAVIIGFVENYQHSQRMRDYTVRAVEQGALLVCADSGGAVAQEWGVTPAVLVGDMDSIDPAILAQFTALPQIQIKQCSPEKDETDLELAIYAALERGVQSLTIIGATGGRLDHTLANLYLLAMPRLQNHPAKILSEEQEIMVLRGGDQAMTLHGQPGETVSLLPFNGDAVGIRTGNLYYPLKNETLFFGPGRGISNVMLGTEAQIELASGMLLVIHLFG